MEGEEGHIHGRGVTGRLRSRPWGQGAFWQGLRCCAFACQGLAWPLQKDKKGRVRKASPSGLHILLQKTAFCLRFCRHHDYTPFTQKYAPLTQTTKVRKRLNTSVTLTQASSQMETAAKKPRRAETRKGAARGRLGKISKSKDVSLETRAATTHTLVVPGTTRACERDRQGRRLKGRRWIRLESGAGGELCGHPGRPAGRATGRRANWS